MRRLRISAAAQRDLDDIWNYVVSQSINLETGNKVLDEIGQRFGLLRHSPLAGRRRDDDFHPGDRSFPAGNYVI
jgi:plasmid stabilization system protein ParE